MNFPKNSPQMYHGLYFFFILEGAYLWKSVSALLERDGFVKSFGIEYGHKICPYFLKWLSYYTSNSRYENIGSKRKNPVPEYLNQAE